jgi:hypothetical protein
MLNPQSILTKINTQISVTLTTCNSTQISGTKQLRNTCTVNITAAYFSQNKCTNFSHIIILSKKKNSTQDQIEKNQLILSKKKINTRSNRINSYSAKIKSTQDQIASTHTQKKKKINNSQIYIKKKKKIRSDLILI